MLFVSAVEKKYYSEKYCSSDILQSNTESAYDSEAKDALLIDAVIENYYTLRKTICILLKSIYENAIIQL